MDLKTIRLANARILQLADVILESGGRIRGVVPKFMKEIEWAHKGVTDIVFTETIQERKAAYLEGVDGLVALPGGSGTLEELLEAISLKRLGLLKVPIVILNTPDCYGPLKEILNRCVTENFMDERHLQMWASVHEPEDSIDALENAPKWSKEAIKFAARIRSETQDAVLQVITEWLIDCASRHSIQRISLSVSRDNCAINLYRQQGFLEYASKEDAYTLVRRVQP